MSHRRSHQKSYRPHLTQKLMTKIIFLFNFLPLFCRKQLHQLHIMWPSLMTRPKCPKSTTTPGLNRPRGERGGFTSVRRGSRVPWKPDSLLPMSRIQVGKNYLEVVVKKSVLIYKWYSSRMFDCSNARSRNNFRRLSQIFGPI